MMIKEIVFNTVLITFLAQPGFAQFTEYPETPSDKENSDSSEEIKRRKEAEESAAEEKKAAAAAEAEVQKRKADTAAIYPMFKEIINVSSNENEST